MTEATIRPAVQYMQPLVLPVRAKSKGNTVPIRCLAASEQEGTCIRVTHKH